jgi:hypothetical protein
VDESTYGSFLAGPLRERVLQEKKDRIKDLAKGSDVSNLYAPDLNEKPEKLAFDRYQSQGEAKQRVKLDE